MKPTEEDYTKEMRQLNEEWQNNLKIQRQMMIDKACEWLKENGYLATNGWYTIRGTLDDFRKAIEE